MVKRKRNERNRKIVMRKELKKRKMVRRKRNERKSRMVKRGMKEK